MSINVRHVLSCLALTFLGACSSLPASLRDSRPRPELLGTAAPAAASTRTIVIGPETRYVNVIGGEIIRFTVGEKSFGWSFSGAVGVTRFDLREVAPPGLLQQTVFAYVAPNPMYVGGDRGD